MRRILRRVSQHSRNLSLRTGLTVPQLLCLRAIREGNGVSAEGEGATTGRVTAAEVSQRVRLSPPTVSRMLDRLERAGVISRERDVEDRRRVWLTLTDEGEARLGKSPTPLQEEFLGRLRSLPPEKRRDLLAALDTIVEMMEAGEIDAAPVLTPESEVRPAAPEARCADDPGS